MKGKELEKICKEYPSSFFRMEIMENSSIFEVFQSWK